MDTNRLRATELEEQQRMKDEATAAGMQSRAVDPVAAPVSPPVVRRNSLSFWSVRLGVVFVLLGGLILKSAVLGKPTTHPEGEIPVAIYRHYGSSGLTIADGLSGTVLLVLGLGSLVHFFKVMPRRRK